MTNFLTEDHYYPIILGLVKTYFVGYNHTSLRLLESNCFSVKQISFVCCMSGAPGRLNTSTWETKTSEASGQPAGLKGKASMFEQAAKDAAPKEVVKKVGNLVGLRELSHLLWAENVGYQREQWRQR